MRKFLVLVIGLFCNACQLPGADVPLVVVIVVDQMRPDYVDRFDADYVGGLRRLIDQGRIYENASYDHAITSTAPGHATIASGTQPAQNGYVGNSWHDHGIGRSVRCSEDENARLLIGEGPAHSPRRLLRTCIGDWLQQASPRSRVVSIADKARSAVALGGQRPQWAIWRERGDFVSSNYYGAEAPAWLLEWNRTHDFQLDENGYLTTDESGLFSLARVVIDELQLGRDGAADLLLLGCSVADYVGHRYGPRSDQVRAYYLQLDRELGAFFEDLDTRLGAGSYRVLLSADHGVAELPEDLAGQGVDAQRITSFEFSAQLDALSESLAERAGIDGPAFADRNQFGIVYSDEFRARMDEALRDFSVESLRALPSVANVYARDGSIGDDEFAPLFRNSFHPSRGYDLYLRHRENWLVGIGPSGSNHGSCYAYDRHVPIITYGPGIEAGRVAAEAHVIQIAPTLARWLGVPVPSDLPAHALGS